MKKPNPGKTLKVYKSVAEGFQFSNPGAKLDPAGKFPALIPKITNPIIATNVSGKNLIEVRVMFCLLPHLIEEPQTRMK